jgi:CRISPR/Cas system-associated exonuclease Cas4 (RecB family)
MTRSRRRLYLTFADEYDDTAGPSPFIELAGLEARRRPWHRDGSEMEPASVLTVAEAETLLAGQVLDGPARQRLAELGVDLDWVADPQAGQPFRPYLERPLNVDPGHFSPTTINDYLRCPRLYFYNAHPGVAAPPRTVALERGSFLHKVLEDFHRREPEWRTLAPELQRDWLDAALAPHITAYLDRVENVLDRKAEEQEVRRILANYIEFATRWQPIRRLGTLVTEKKFFLDVEGSEVRGKIDRIIDTGDGTCEVVDYKTGRGLGIERTYERYFGPELYDVQLAMYYLACNEGLDDEGARIGLKPRFLSLWFPKDRVYGSIRQSLFPVGGAVPGVPDRQQHPVETAELARGKERVAVAIRRIRAGDFAPAPRSDAPGTCLSWVGCPHAAICPYGGQPEE